MAYIHVQHLSSVREHVIRLCRKARGIYVSSMGLQPELDGVQMTLTRSLSLRGGSSHACMMRVEVYCKRIRLVIYLRTGQMEARRGRESARHLIEHRLVCHSSIENSLRPSSRRGNLPWCSALDKVSSLGDGQLPTSQIPGNGGRRTLAATVALCQKMAKRHVGDSASAGCDVDLPS